MNILLTGGAGYIGGHTTVVLTQADHEVVLLDNVCNSKKSVLGQSLWIFHRAIDA
jgi:UDP-glucose 4-epimerase